MEKKTTCTDGPCFRATTLLLPPVLGLTEAKTTARQTKLCARAVGILARPPPHWYLWPCGLRGLGVSDESLLLFHATTQPKPRFAGALFYWEGTEWGVRRQLPKAKEASIVRASMKQHHKKKNKDSIK